MDRPRNPDGFPDGSRSSPQRNNQMSGTAQQTGPVNKWKKSAEHPRAIMSPWVLRCDLGLYTPPGARSGETNCTAQEVEASLNEPAASCRFFVLRKTWRWDATSTPKGVECPKTHVGFILVNIPRRLMPKGCAIYARSNRQGLRRSKKHKRKSAERTSKGPLSRRFTEEKRRELER